MKGALDDFKVMLTRNEPITGLAKVVAFLVIFALGVVAGLWVSAGIRRSQESIVTRSIGFQGSGGGICCRPDLDPRFEEFVAPTRLMHDMTDEELFWRATLVPAAARYPFERVPKVAFMFLTRGPLPLAPLWDRFFAGAGDAGLFSVYVHATPGYRPDFPPASAFYRRLVPSQVRCSTPRHGSSFVDVCLLASCFALTIRPTMSVHVARREREYATAKIRHARRTVWVVECGWMPERGKFFSQS